MTLRILRGQGYYGSKMLFTADGRPILIDLDSIPSATGIGATHNSTVIATNVAPWGAGPSFSTAYSDSTAAGTKRPYWSAGTKITNEITGPAPFYPKYYSSWKFDYLNLMHEMTTTATTLWWEVRLQFETYYYIKGTKSLSESDPSPFGVYGNISINDQHYTDIFTLPTQITVVRP